MALIIKKYDGNYIRWNWGAGLYAITKFIDKAQLIKLAEPLKKNGYGQYLLKSAK